MKRYVALTYLILPEGIEDEAEACDWVSNTLHSLQDNGADWHYPTDAHTKEIIQPRLMSVKEVDDQGRVMQLLIDAPEER